MSHQAERSFNGPVQVSNEPSFDRELSRHKNHPGDDQIPSLVRYSVAHTSPRWTTTIIRSLICTIILVSAGCGSQTDSQGYSEEEVQAQRDQLAKAFPVPPPDTPEQIQEKEAKVEATLPQVYEMLEEVESDPTKIDEVVELSMSLLTLVPGHRAAKVAYGKAQLASFQTKETTDAYNALIAINSAVLEMDRLRENFDDLSEDELQLCQEVYFNQARREGYYPQGEDAPNILKEAISKLMASGFRDADRLKTEPKLQFFFNDPMTAPVLQSAIEQMQSSSDESSSE